MCFRLAFVCGVVASFPEHMPDRRDVGRQIRDPREIQVLIHASVGCLQPGREHRSGGCALCSGTVVFMEVYACFLQPFEAGKRETSRPFLEVGLQVSKNEQDI